MCHRCGLLQFFFVLFPLQMIRLHHQCKLSCWTFVSVSGLNTENHIRLRALSLFLFVGYFFGFWFDQIHAIQQMERRLCVVANMNCAKMKLWNQLEVLISHGLVVASRCSDRKVRYVCNIDCYQYQAAFLRSIWDERSSIVTILDRVLIWFRDRISTPICGGGACHCTSDSRIYPVHLADQISQRISEDDWTHAHAFLSFHIYLRFNHRHLLSPRTKSLFIFKQPFKYLKYTPEVECFYSTWIHFQDWSIQKL